MRRIPRRALAGAQVLSSAAVNRPLAAGWCAGGAATLARSVSVAGGPSSTLAPIDAAILRRVPQQGGPGEPGPLIPEPSQGVRGVRVIRQVTQYGGAVLQLVDDLAERVPVRRSPPPPTPTGPAPGRWSSGPRAGSPPRS